MNPRTPSTTAAPLVKEKDGSADEVTALARGLTVLRSIAAADALWDKVQNNVALPPSTIAKTTIVHPTDYTQYFPCTK